MIRRYLLRFGLSLLVSAALLYWAFRDVNIRSMWQLMRGVKPVFFLLHLVLLALVQVCRVYRWEALVRPFAPMTARASWRVSGLGGLLTLLLPLRLGEFARPYLLKQETGASMGAGIGAAAVERVIDGLAVTVLFFVTTFWLRNTYPVPDALWWAAVLAMVFFLLVGVFIVGTILSHGTLLRWARRVGDPLAPALTNKIVGILDSFVAGLRSLGDVRVIAVAMALTIAYWVVNGLGLYVMIVAFGWHLPLLAGFTLTCIIVVAIMIPAGPGFLGTFQGAITGGLSIFGVGVTEAAAYGAIVYPFTVLAAVIWGLPYLFNGKTRIADMVQTAELSTT